MSKYLITLPNRIKTDIVEFRISDDDMSKAEADSFCKFMTSNGFKFKRSKRYSQTKCMAWFVFKLQPIIPRCNFDLHLQYAKNLVNSFEVTKNN